MGYAAVDIKTCPKGSDRCFYCAAKLIPGPSQQVSDPPSNIRTRDHVTPLIKGGYDSGDNKVWCCFGCNQDKGNLTLEEYRLVVAFRKGFLENVQVFHKFAGE